jgi:hypothetical protein
VRKYGRTDVNQQEIVDALRMGGATVRDMSGIGRGFPDLCVGFRGRNWLLEVKRDGKAKFTLDQQTFQASWGGQWARVSNSVEAWEVINGR